MPSQLTLCFDPSPALGRSDFLVAEGNRAAVAFIDAWPHWPGPAALYGPSGTGKSHLVTAWAAMAGAQVFAAASLHLETVVSLHADEPVAVEDVDNAAPNDARDRALFALFERGTPFLLTGRKPAAQWPTVLPDLSSRLKAILSFPLWAPDDALLAALARKLFADRQLQVPDAVIAQMIVSLERSPSAIRDFVARADAKALAEKRPVTVALIRELLAASG
jgi:chromosomal replication initiation ATPase DnaA